MSRNGPWSSGQGLNNVNIQLLSFLCNFVTKSVCPTPIKMPLRVLWSMGLKEGVNQQVDMSLSRNKLACVLASIIGIPCNVPLPMAVLCVPMAVLNEGSQGFNGTPVSFKQTQGAPLLFSMLHRTAGSPQGSHLGACNPHGAQGPAACSLLCLWWHPLRSSTLILCSHQYVGVLLFSGLITRCGANRVSQRGRSSCSGGTGLVTRGKRPPKFTVRQGEGMAIVSMSAGSNYNNRMNLSWQDTRV